MSVRLWDIVVYGPDDPPLVAETVYGSFRGALATARPWAAAFAARDDPAYRVEIVNDVGTVSWSWPGRPRKPPHHDTRRPRLSSLGQ